MKLKKFNEYYSKYANSEISEEEYFNFIADGNFLNFTDNQYKLLSKSLMQQGFNGMKRKIFKRFVIEIHFNGNREHNFDTHENADDLIEFIKISIHNIHENCDDYIHVLQMSDEWFLILHDCQDEYNYYKCDSFKGLIKEIDEIMDSSCYTD